MATSMVRVSNVDRTYAGNPVCYLVGPLRSADTTQTLRRRLIAIANSGPANRIGLLPNKAARRWRFDPLCESITITTGPAPDMTNPAEAMSRLDAAAADVPSIPLHLHLAAPWLFVKFDHGLGGGRLFTELIAAIGCDELGFAQPLPDSSCSRPGLRAAVSMLRRNPTRLLADMNEVHRRGHDLQALMPTDGVVSIAYARSRPSFLDDLRLIRDRRFPGVSLTAMITSCFLNSLNEHGIEVHETVSFLVDLARYLPDGVGTLSNFVGTAPVHVSRPFDPRNLTAGINEYTEGARSLVRFGMAYAMTLLHGPPGNILYQGDDSRAKITISDHASTTAAGKIAWADSPDGHIFVRKAPVGFTNQITLAINRIRSQLHLTASYYETAFDRSTVQAVLDKMTTHQAMPLSSSE
jgi:hypothetical protein